MDITAFADKASARQPLDETDARMVAVAIGINNYGGVTGFGLGGGRSYATLARAVNDATQLCVMLSRGWGKDAELTLIGDAPPPYTVPNTAVRDPSLPLTSEDLLEEIRSAVDAARPQDTVLVYVVGHGTVTRQGEVCLILPGGSQLERVPLRALTHACDGSKARHRIVIFDCCQDLDEEEMELGDETGLDELKAAYMGHLQTLAREWVVWLTCSLGETAVEDSDQDPQRAGAFMACLFESMHDVATTADQAIDLPSLIAAVSNRVRIEVDERYQARGRGTGAGLKIQQSPLVFRFARCDRPIADPIRPMSLTDQTEQKGREKSNHWGGVQAILRELDSVYGRALAGDHSFTLLADSHQRPVSRWSTGIYGAGVRPAADPRERLGNGGGDRWPELRSVDIATLSWGSGERALLARRGVDRGSDAHHLEPDGLRGDEAAPPSRGQPGPAILPH